MTLPLSFWALLASQALVAFLCRRWPDVALCGAAAGFCDVARAVLLGSPDGPLVLGCDAFLFAAPTAVLAAACGVPRIPAALFVPIVLTLVLGDGVAESRQAGLVFFVVVAQGTAAIWGTRLELDADRPRWSRRAAVVLAWAGVVGGAFSACWPDVAAVGASAHAFVALAYLAGQRGDEIDGQPLGE
jgi:hypothetical protein